jgi:ketosteroid isomerase-like protein
MAVMRTHLPVLLLASFLPLAQSGSLPARSQSQQSDALVTQPPDAEFRGNFASDIKRVLVSQVEAWNHGDLDAFMQGYWHSPELTFFSGATVTKGWEPTLARYRQRYKSEGKEMGKLEFQDLHIEILSQRSAVVTGKWRLSFSTKMSDGKQPHGLFTLIFKPTSTGWKIVHDHTSVAE